MINCLIEEIRNDIHIQRWVKLQVAKNNKYGKVAHLELAVARKDLLPEQRLGEISFDNHI